MNRRASTAGIRSTRRSPGCRTTFSALGTPKGGESPPPRKPRGRQEGRHPLLGGTSGDAPLRRLGVLGDDGQPVHGEGFGRTVHETPGTVRVHSGGDIQQRREGFPTPEGGRQTVVRARGARGETVEYQKECRLGCRSEPAGGIEANPLARPRDAGSDTRRRRPEGQ